jgi:uncharacterized protein (TIGR03083 family)
MPATIPRLPALDQVRAERHAFVDTVASLPEADFESGTTLCEGWAPRDVLAHLIGTARIADYLRAPWRLHQINERFVADARPKSRDEMIAAGRSWAGLAGRADRTISPFLLGDVAVHHQDVLRGAGLTRVLPRHIESAVFHEGVVLSLQRRRPTLLRYRVEPSNGIGAPLGRGPRVLGPAEALGMWLAGRDVPDVTVEA